MNEPRTSAFESRRALDVSPVGTTISMAVRRSLRGLAAPMPVEIHRLTQQEPSEA